MTRVAVLPRGVDGLFLRPPDGVELVVLVERGGADEAWARRVYPEPAICTYDVTAELPCYPGTAELLAGSDIGPALRRAGVDALLLTTACSPAIDAWARREQIALVMSDYEDQRLLEDKLWFSAFLARHGLPQPPGGPVSFAAGDRLPFRGRAVVQIPDSMGGEGTFFVDDDAALARLLADGVLRRDRPYLARRFVDGVAYGITLFCTPGTVLLSAIRRQCYEDGEGPVRPFLGVQWIASDDLAPGLRRRLGIVFGELGRLLHSRRFFGFANVDFLVDRRQRIAILECNPRLSAATPQLLHVRALLSELAGTTFLRAFLGPRRFPREPGLSNLPNSRYRGATLDLLAPGPSDSLVARAAGLTGLWTAGGERPVYLGPDLRRLARDDELAVVALARSRGACEPGDALATVLSNAPLYDDEGRLTEHARRLRAHLLALG